MSFLPPYTVDWQHLVVLLTALDKMTGDIPTRGETVEFIQREGYLELRPEDQNPYPSQSEPSWQTDIAFARKYAVIFGMVNNTEWNSWELFRAGREFLQDAQAKCEDGRLSVSRCPLWSERFKRLMSSSYEPSEMDIAPVPKGKRSIPPLREFENAVDILLLRVPLGELAARLSEILNHYVSATKPSVAYALWLSTTLDSERTESGPCD